jgi:hypothetical protein
MQIIPSTGFSEAKILNDLKTYLQPWPECLPAVAVASSGVVPIFSVCVVPFMSYSFNV